MMARINYYLNYANNPAGGRYVTALMKEGLANVPILNPAGEWLHLWDDSHTEAAMSFYLILKEPGVLPTIILMAGMVALFVCMASGVSKQKNVPGSLLGMACVMGLVIPAAGYVLTNLTMIPYTDFYIPFLGGQCGKLYAAWPVFIRVPVHRCGGVINTVINTGAMA